MRGFNELKITYNHLRFFLEATIAHADNVAIAVIVTTPERPVGGGPACGGEVVERLSGEVAVLVVYCGC